MQPKKSLGQNFLKSGKILDKIIEAGKVSKNDTVLEIGPGEGTLTEKLLKKAGKVVAVEKDDRLIPLLEEKFKPEIDSGKLKLVCDDILEFSIFNFQFSKKPYKLIANIPYYITGQFLKKFLSGESQPSLMVIMVQKEVAKRVVARDEKESLLSISVKAYGKPKYIQTVSKSFFSPQPKVDSAILLIDEINKENFKNVSEKRFWEILKAGFAHKRKFLSRNLEKGAEKEKIENAMSKCALSKNSRAEDLSLSDWLCLAQNL